MNINIRKAEEKDYEAVLIIMNQVQTLHVEMRPDVYKPNDTTITKEEFVSELEAGLFFVAESDNKIVGTLGLSKRHVERPTHVTKDILFIDAMAVDEAYRGKGIGHAFFEYLKQYKDKLSCDTIELQVNARNKAAYDMYVKYGFREKSINMELV